MIATILALGAKGADPIEIDALGGVIPNAGGETEVHIVSATGSGNSITLAVDKVTVKALVQKQSDVNAVVSMLREQQLLLGKAAVLQDMRDLTIGEVMNDGSIGGIGSAQLELLVEGVGSHLYLNAVCTNALTKTTKKTGEGMVVANGDFHASVDQVAGTMGFVVVNSSVLENLKTLDIAGSGLIYDYDSSGLDPDFGTAGSSVAGSTKDATLTSESSVPLRGFNVNGGTRVRMENMSAYLPSAEETLRFGDESVPSEFCVGSESAGLLALDGGSLLSKLTLGSTTSGKGGLWIRGGAVVTNVCSTTNREYLVGNGGFGHINIDGGTYVAAGDWGAANGGYASIAITNGNFVQTDSETRTSGIGFGGTSGKCSIYVTADGSFDVSQATTGINIPDSLAADYVQITVENGGLLNFGSGRLLTTDRVVFNFNDGGKVTVGAFDVNTAGGSATGGALYQFNGGIFTPAMANSDMFDGTLISYSRGATFHIASGSSSLEFASPLEKPTGYGLVAIDVPDSITNKVFVGAPVVVISSTGSGRGASAICELNPSTGKIARFRVTGRGTGYSDWGTATLYYANESYQIDSDCLHWESNVSGGLTKTGGGTLVLKGINTYTGTTKITGGRLQLSGQGTISPESPLAIYNGGILDLGGGTFSFSDYNSDGNASVTNGTCIFSGLVFDMDKVRATPPDIDTLHFTTNMEFSIVAGVKLLHATDLSRNNDYVLCNLTGDYPERMPPLDAETRELLSDSWGIMIIKDESNGTAKAVLHYFGGSLFIYY